jgi:hypothetical protein
MKRETALAALIQLYPDGLPNNKLTVLILCPHSPRFLKCDFMCVAKRAHLDRRAVTVHPLRRFRGRYAEDHQVGMECRPPRRATPPL